ncbi:nucleoside triphosphate hydrolase, partial [Vibrio sp. S512-13]
MREPQPNMMVPRFAHDEAMSQIHANPPQWLVPTRDVSAIPPALKYKPKKTPRKLLSKTAVLIVDILDYPGERLLDLPLLVLDFS